MSASNYSGVSLRRARCRRRWLWVDSAQAMIALRSWSRSFHGGRFSKFFWSTVKNDSIATLSPADGTRPMDP